MKKIFQALIITTILLIGNISFAQTVPAFVQNDIAENLSVAETYTNGFNTLADFTGMYIEPQNNQGTSTHELTTEKSLEGGFSHKAWMYGTNPVVSGTNTNHRAYPTFQMNNTPFGIATGATLIDFYVWVDINLFNQAEKNWLSLATFSSYSDQYWPHSYLINVDKDYKMGFQHVPVHEQSTPDIFHNTSIVMPSNQWVRVTVYIDYTSANTFNSPTIALWQDGVMVMASKFNHRIEPSAYAPADQPACASGWNGQLLIDLENMCSFVYTGGLAQMHFGLYTPPLLSSGTIYNDALTVQKLNKN